jgi:hypothetical protein
LRVVGVDLEACAFEILNQQLLSAVGFHHRLRDRVAEERQALTVADVRITKVETVAPVRRREFGGDGVPRLWTVITFAWVGLRQRMPVAARPPQVIVAEAAEQHIVWPGVLGMILESLPLEILGQIGLRGIRVDFGLGC